MIIRSRAPVRVSFGGGGTDLSPYCDLYGGVVLNGTITRYIYVTLIPNNSKKIKIISVDYKKTLKFSNLNEIKFNGDIDLIKAVVLRMKPGYGFDLILRSDIPPNTGLGSSGAVAVATIGAFNHIRSENKLNKYEIAEMAHKIETEDLSNVGGRQDQYASVFGGINYMEFFQKDFVRIIPLNVPKDHILELEKHLVLSFVLDRGPSGNVQEIMVDQMLNEIRNDNKNKVETLDQLKEYCNKMYESLSKGEFDTFGLLMHKSWATKRKLSSKISNKKIDIIYNDARNAGALGGKITGAGGGGCMIFFCESNQEHSVSSQLVKSGAEVINFSFDNTGLVTWEIPKNNRNVSTISHLNQ